MFAISVSSTDFDHLQAMPSSMLHIFVFFVQHKPVAPIGFMEAKINGLLPVSGAGFGYYFYNDASIYNVIL